jgi:hypothetical protein
MWNPCQNLPMFRERRFKGSLGRAGQWRERFPHREFSETEIAYLNDRYGKATISWRIPGLLFALIGIPWLLWSALYHSNPEIRFTLLDFQPQVAHSNSAKPSIQIRYQVQRRNPSQAITCTLVARDIDKNVVGEITDQIAPSAEKSIIRIVQIPARLKPVNAAVLDCR